MAVADAGERIPISLVTGFLGSGKTTLIAALLKQPAMAGTAVVVNEFGAVGIDDAVFAQSIDAETSCFWRTGAFAAPPATILRRPSGRSRGGVTVHGRSSSRRPASPTLPRCFAG